MTARVCHRKTLVMVLVKDSKADFILWRFLQWDSVVAERLGSTLTPTKTVGHL